ncbi:acetate/propionate family kinase [Actinokineospora sp. NBRC 105648]|uniref:acetate/propionate family kinase n=1 Tax=Actinokineospora sp. NBRC 105648 TaxID=3032206 RepID=UPI0024A20211|nr:acetate/propionate family kinase [Actinokineospora sp. NBRC 105648]GLZ40740.1 acetate kinase [Actinokineospora sp. NBRC 105648]
MDPAGWGLTVRVLVVNAGSSSLKLRLLDHDDAVLRAAEPTSPAGLACALRGWERPDVVGHRIVHGGTEYTGPVRVDDEVRARLEELTDLAPLHQPAALTALDEVTTLLPGVPAVACFDTAFHAGMPAAAATYAVPAEWRERYAIRRYGFHGLSHAYCSQRAARMLDRPRAGLRVVTCHLGAGASLAAVLDGRGVDTTMGFTPLEGLVMATRSGTVDPGLVLWLQEHGGLSAHEVATALEHRSGLVALAGSADLREVEAAAGRGAPDALLALAVYTHRLVAGIASMAAAIGGLDVLAFTGGVGENSATVRARATDRLAFLGVAIDPAGNRSASGDTDISAPGAAVRTVVVAAREDLQIAHETRLLSERAPR